MLSVYPFYALVLLPITLHNKTVYNDREKTAPPPRRWEEIQPAIFFGLFTSSQTIKAAEKCPGEVYLVEIKRSAANVLVLILTAGIYSPYTVRITCLPQNNKEDELTL